MCSDTTVTLVIVVPKILSCLGVNVYVCVCTTIVTGNTTAISVYYMGRGTFNIIICAEDENDPKDWWW